jgi:tetratricopeptide (TPR) repeat protein
MKMVLYFDPVPLVASHSENTYLYATHTSMNRQSLLEYLEEPAKLYQLPLVELQGLVMTYPYATNLRLLLFLKARLDDHPRKEEMLQQLATRTFDRSYLYDMIRDLEREEQQLGAEKEERLELQDLEKLDFAFAEPEAIPAQPPSIADSFAIESDPPAAAAEAMQSDNFRPSPPPVSETEEVLEPEASDESTEAPAQEDILGAEQVAGTIPQAQLSLLSTAVAISEIVSDYHLNYAPPVPMPTEHFTAQEDEVEQLSRAKDRLRRHRVQQLDRMKNRRRDALKEIVRQSVSQKEATASETLAKILAQQGQYAKAIKMYERLSLSNPEKSANFAGLIKELKEKL